MNQNLEQLARTRIDEKLNVYAWTIQNKAALNLLAALGRSAETVYPNLFNMPQLILPQPKI